MPPPDTSAWTPGPASDASAWTPGPATFHQDNAVDAQGHAVVKDWADHALDALPWLGGLVGGGTGGIGGTAFGMAVGGVPGAVGGAALGGAAGESVKEMAERLRGKFAPVTAGDAAKAIGTAAAVQGGGELLGQGLAKGASLLAPRIMQGAVKPGLRMLKGDLKAGRDVPQVVHTLLDEGVNVTPGGLNKLQLLFDQTNDTLKSALTSAKGTIDPLGVTRTLVDTSKRFAAQVAPSADLNTIASTGADFLASHPNALTVPQAQAIKSGTYAQLRNTSYGQLTDASREAQKALARGLREAIEAEAPQVAGLNARESTLIQAIDAVGKRVALAGNRDPVGFAWVAHNPTQFLAALFDRSPVVKSLVARGLYVPAGQSAKVAPELIRTAVSALASTAQPDDAPPDGSTAK